MMKFKLSFPVLYGDVLVPFDLKIARAIRLMGLDDKPPFRRGDQDSRLWLKR